MRTGLSSQNDPDPAMNRRTHRAIFLFLFIAFSNGALAQTTPIESVRDAIVHALESRWIVAIGENHGHVEFHNQLAERLADAKIQAIVDDIAVEFGNSLYQGVMDRYIGGASVPYDSVKLAWRNTIVSPYTVWDSPVYEQFFQRVREVNLMRTDGRQFRVVLADSPVDWDAVKTFDDLRPFFDRSVAMTSSVEREILSRGRRGLLIAGGAHLTRANMVRMSRNGVPNAEVSVVSRLAMRHPGALFVIKSLGKGRAVDHSLLTDVRPGSLILTSDPRVASIQANKISSMKNFDGSPFNAYGSATLADLADALIYWGVDENNHFVDAPASLYRDDDFWAELNRRSNLTGRGDMDPELRRDQ